MRGIQDCTILAMCEGPKGGCGTYQQSFAFAHCVAVTEPAKAREHSIRNRSKRLRILERGGVDVQLRISASGFARVDKWRRSLGETVSGAMQKILLPLGSFEKINFKIEQNSLEISTLSIAKQLHRHRWGAAELDLKNPIFIVLGETVSGAMQTPFKSSYTNWGRSGRS